MLRQALYWFTGWLPTRLIKVHGVPYLERYLLFNFWGLTVYIHRFLADDPDRGYHNHPWNSLAFCLLGGYEETRLESLKQVRWKFLPWGFNLITINTFHRVKLLAPEAWTILIRGPRNAQWGFLMRDTCSRYRDHNGQWHEEELWAWKTAKEVTDTPGGWERYSRGWDSEREPL